MISCTFENGIKAVGLRHVTVGVLVVDKNNRVLLVQREASLWNGNKYTIPGGFLDRGENIETGALRELQEETGLTGHNAQLFRINDNPKRPKEDRQNVDFIYTVDDVTGNIKPDHETNSVGWFSEENLPPDAEFAFDHRESILKYFAYRKKSFDLPIIG